MSPTCKKTPWTPRFIALRQGGQPLGPKSVVIWKCFTTLCQRFYRLSISPSVLKICFFKVRAYGPIGVISLNFLTVKIMLKIRLKAVGGGPGCFLHVKFIWKCCSIRSQRFLPFVNISLGAQDMFRQSSAALAKMHNIPIRSLLKNHAENEH